LKSLSNLNSTLKSKVMFTFQWSCVIIEIDEFFPNRATDNDFC